MPNPEGNPHRSRNRASTSATRPVAVRSRIPLRQLLRVASVASGIQFGWALQLSLLTPYVQQLGIPHQWASIIWLCGPVSGLFVQPLVGHLSDRCSSRFGRRRPFILAGAASIIVAVIIIGYAADIGWALGDDETQNYRPRAIVVFVVGFWILDVANNVTQGPCRALLGDLTSKDPRRTRVANAYFSLFMAIGNILGYATGSYSGWYKIFTFTFTPACAISCANLKSAFFLDVAFIAVTTYLSIVSAHEVPLSSCGEGHTGEGRGESGSAEEAFMWELFGTFKYFTTPIWIVLSVTALTWIGWFPFILFDTDWMGREIYGGDPNGGLIYDAGVRMGALGLLLNSVVLGVTSLLMERLCRKRGAGFVWGISNILMAVCFLAMLVLTYVANIIGYVGKHLPPPTGVVIAALIIFTILGFPLAITYSVPYALISTHIEPLGLGQGLSMGVLNLAIVVPQDLNSGKTIGSAKESGGLYYLEDGIDSRPSCFESIFVSTSNDIMLWHLRLGHPSFLYLKHLFPKLFNDKDLSLFYCETCKFAKHRFLFSIQPYKKSKSFAVIHSDVWGPNRINTFSNKKWFITFIDDHIRLCWVCLLKENFEVKDVKNFFKMVQTQFQTNIQVFRSDNGKEYFNMILGDFFLENRVVHHSSCANTPQQNGVAERKNKHLIEVA